MRAVALALCLALGSSCSGSPASGPPGVLLITVDTLRPDHLGLYGYARGTSLHIDRFFRAGAVFERSYSTEARTPQSVISILSGQLPQHHGVRRFIELVPEGTKLIPDLLPAAYQSAGFVANAVVTDEAIGIAKRFDHFDDYVDTQAPHTVNFERNARRTTDAALHWLEHQRDPARPLFLWIHYMDPHTPYTPPESWRRSFSHAEPAIVSLDDPAALLLRRPETRAQKSVDGLDWVDAYDEEIAYLDAQVGRLLEGYARHARLDEALVVFSADHGESLLEHELYFAHGYHVHEEIIRVPLLLRGPGVAQGRRTGLVSGIDVAPTILGFAGATIPRGLSGLDLRRVRRIDPERVVFAETRILAYPGQRHRSRLWRTAIQGERKWRLGFSMDSTELLERSFIDLGADPQEAAPQAWREGGAAAALIRLAEADPLRGAALKQFRKGHRPTAPIVAPRATEEQRDELRALGYIE